MSKLISVIVPIYNVENYLDKCIESICAQKYQKLQIILVDDGSQDRCGEICEQWKERDARIQVLHKENGGLSDARNAGMAVAKGEYIGFVDSDDWIEENMYLELLKLLNTYKADIAICNKREIFSDKYEREHENAEEISVWNQKQAMRELVKNEKISSHVWNKLYKRELFDGIQFEVGKAYEDVYIMHEIFGHAKTVVNTSKKYYNYLQRSTSILGDMNLRKQIDLYWGYRRRYDYLADRYPELRQDLSVHMYYVLWGIIQNALDYDYGQVKRVVKDYNALENKVKSKRNVILKHCFDLIWIYRNKLK